MNRSGFVSNSSSSSFILSSKKEKVKFQIEFDLMDYAEESYIGKEQIYDNVAKMTGYTKGELAMFMLGLKDLELEKNFVEMLHAANRGENIYTGRYEDFINSYLDIAITNRQLTNVNIITTGGIV